jgi:HSP20 family protein
MSLVTAAERPFQSMPAGVNKMMDQLSKGYFGFAPSDTWTPNVNLYETDEAYVVCVDLAGVDKKKIDIEVDGQRLILRGARPVPTMPDGELSPDGSGPQRRLRVHLMEIDHGTFGRQVELPDDVQKERITATHRNGMLWIELPKKA